MDIQNNNDRRERIINASFKVFSKNEYRKASVDEIVTEAGVSKGLVFHYFGNKRKLYMFLYEYSLELMMNESYDMLDCSDTDFFNRLNHIVDIKIKLVKNHPYIYDFIKQGYLEKDESLKSEIEAINSKYQPDGMKRALENIDYSKFKEGLNPQLIIKMITWMAEGYVNENLTIKSIDDLIQGYRECLDLLKNNLYREEFLK